MYRYLSFQTVNLSFQTINLSFQTVNLSFYVVLSIILDNKFIVCYRFSCKNPTQNNKFIILYRFCLNKITTTPNSKNQSSFELYNKFFCFHVVSFRIVGQKKGYRRKKDLDSDEYLFTISNHDNQYTSTFMQSKLMQFNRVKSTNRL